MGLYNKTEFQILKAAFFSAIFFLQATNASSYSLKSEEAAPWMNAAMARSLSPNLTECPSYMYVCDYLLNLSDANPHVSVIEDHKSDGLRSIYFVAIKPYIQPNARNAEPNSNRSSYWLEGGLDAHPCLVVSMLLAIVDMLANDCPPEFRNNNYYLVPLANPDGHEYARTTAGSSWVKNRAPNFGVGSACNGTRLNRNFPPGGACSPIACPCSDPCSDDYCGSSPSSSAEVTALITLKNSVPQLTMSFTFLTHVRQLVLYPMARVDNSQEVTHDGLANTAKTYIQTNGGPSTTIGQYYTFFPHSGTSMDYWHLNQPSCKSFTFFMKPEHQGENAFDRAKRILNSIFAMIQTI